MKIFFRLFMVIALGMSSCRIPFDPEVPDTFTNVLIVEGYLDSEGKPSELRLSKTVPLSADTSSLPETNAQVFLTAFSGESYPLTETEPGIYLFQADVPEEGTYTLEIQLANGDRYQSQPIRPILTPEIIDVGFNRNEEGVEVFVSTQGNENANDFLWTFEEAWIYRPRIRTTYIYDAELEDVRFRTEAEQISLCFKTASSPDILLETSSRFQDQVVFQKTITQIPEGNERIMERYSILIAQKAIAEDAVLFWDILKKNTEDIGSIFSPLPSQITGNIRSLDEESRPVVGQVSMGVVQEVRLYIDFVDVLPWPYIDPQFNDCAIGLELIRSPFYSSFFGSGFVLPARELMEGTTIVGYYPTDRRCADCTLYASPVRPDFWEDE
ncbi:DUF4249 domain-containing protein [Algoriphagus confluentis]|uniref:DUF4249 domain-containing protein n=1 Tax=Algoriphagus confluentis TaxID=1697556 RepID=A0ABQ6PKI8_9BACT|nr:hypothetical protein Aconfl_09210 [Algoriphagus confluentis]